ncbi:MAG: hypothetical protein JWN12_535 [Candidatus Saccharibacteria bacterium]|nr:hypothetical protein [Candidatus Saccharibacteria bacterium]
MKFISIEGSSYVGKTTIINDLAKIGFQTIPEYDAFGPFVQSDGRAETNKRIAQDFIRREQQRTAQLNDTSSQIVFADRSPLSLITFEDMQEFEHPHKNTSKNETRKYIIESLENEITKGTIVLPNALIVPRIDSPEAFLERVSKRGITPIQELSKFAIQQFITEKTIGYGVQLFGTDGVTSVDVSGKDPSEVTNLVIMTAQKTMPSLQTRHIIDLL